MLGPAHKCILLRRPAGGQKAPAVPVTAPPREPQVPPAQRGQQWPDLVYRGSNCCQDSIQHENYPWNMRENSPSHSLRLSISFAKHAPAQKMTAATCKSQAARGRPIIASSADSRTAVWTALLEQMAAAPRPAMQFHVMHLCGAHAAQQHSAALPARWRGRQWAAGSRAPLAAAA